MNQYLDIETSFRLLCPSFDHFEEAIFNDINGSTVGFSISAIDKKGIAMGGGCDSNPEVARRIAISECIERSLFRRLATNDALRKEFSIDLWPTTCGFAAGFENGATRFRAICEGIERWMWEQWIDHDCPMTEISPEKIFLSPLADKLLQMLEGARFFTKQLDVRDPVSESEVPLHFGVVIAKSGIGVFPGSRVSNVNDDIWTHAAIEAWRHWRIFEMEKGLKIPREVAHERIFFFGENAPIAWKQIERKKHARWHQPDLAFVKDYSLHSPKGIFLCRSLCQGFHGWHKGPLERFIY